MPLARCVLIIAFVLLVSLPVIALAHQCRLVFKANRQAYYALMYRIALMGIVLGVASAVWGTAHFVGAC